MNTKMTHNIHDHTHTGSGTRTRILSIINASADSDTKTKTYPNTNIDINAESNTENYTNSDNGVPTLLLLLYTSCIVNTTVSSFYFQSLRSTLQFDDDVTLHAHANISIHPNIVTHSNISPDANIHCCTMLIEALIRILNLRSRTIRILIRMRMPMLSVVRTLALLLRLIPQSI